MLCRHTAAVNRQVDCEWTGRVTAEDASPHRHDGLHRAL